MRSRRNRRVVTCGVAVVLLLAAGPGSGAGAVPGDLDRVAPGIAAALQAAGLSTEQIDPALVARLGARLTSLVDQGVVSERELVAGLADLAALQASGRLADVVADRLDTHRARHEERRQAMEARLAELGITVPPGADLRTVLAEHGLHPRDLAPGRPEAPGGSEEPHGAPTSTVTAPTSTTIERGEDDGGTSTTAPSTDDDAGRDDSDGERTDDTTGNGGNGGNGGGGGNGGNGGGDNGGGSGGDNGNGSGGDNGNGSGGNGGNGSGGDNGNGSGGNGGNGSGDNGNGGGDNGNGGDKGGSGDRRGGRGRGGGDVTTTTGPAPTEPAAEAGDA